MNNEITNNEIMENVEETVKGNGLKKGAIALGIAGAIAGLGYAVFKFGKRLVNKIKQKRAAKKVSETEADEFLKSITADSELNEKKEQKSK